MKREKCKFVVMAIFVSFMLTACAETRQTTTYSKTQSYEEKQAIYSALLGIKKMEQGYIDEAIGYFNVSFNLDPQNAAYKKMLGIAYGARGVDKGKRGLLNGAIIDLETCIRIMPKDGDQKDFEKALAIIYAARAAGNEQIGNDFGAVSDYLNFLKYARQ